MSDYENQSENQAILDYMESKGQVGLIELPDGKKIASVPQGRKLESLKPFEDKYLTAPERYRGTSKHERLASFVEHINRHKDEHSVVFANSDRSKPQLTAVYNYNQPNVVGGETEATPGIARFGDHRALYDCQLADEWVAWSAQNKEGMGQAAFAEFIEDRILDVRNPPDMADPANAEWKQLQSILGFRFATQAKIMELSRGIAINESAKVQNVVNLASGEVQMQFATEHTDGQGNKLDVPQLFMIGIPVFKDGLGYRFAVRLKYRKRDGSITWFYDIYRLDEGFNDAYADVCRAVREQTGLPVFNGSQEQ